MKIDLSISECKKILNEVKQEKTSFTKAAKKYNVTQVTLSNQIKKKIPEEYLEYKNEKENAKLTEKHCKELFEKYKNGMSLSDIGKEVKKGKGTIKKILLSFGFDVTKTKRYGKISDYDINENFFENIDSEEKAYWLGFFLADGYITKNNKNIELTLQEQDKKHVENFRKSLNSTNKISYREKQKAYRFFCSSEKICKDLNKLGVYNNKSLTYSLNEKILFSNLGRHYLRGLIDANGTIHIDKKGCYTVALTCNEFVANQIKKHINVFHNKNINKSAKNKAVDIRIHGKKAILFLQYLYKNSNIYLERKQKKAVAVLENVVKTKEGFQEVLVG